MLILLVEDDRDLREALTTLLTKSGHMVTPLQNPHTALTMLNQRQFQLAVIDLGLPGMDGLELIRALRQRNFEIPVLVITARAATNERITGLDAGADDYLTKPFETSEFEARIRALLRRTYGTHNNETRMGQISFHPHLSIVTIENSSIELSGSEYSLLKLLCKNTGKVVSKERISSQLTRNDTPPTDTAIEICIHRLRKKMDSFDIKIRTLRGFGYMIELDGN